MKLCVLIVLTSVIASSCQKTISDFAPSVIDSTLKPVSDSGQLIGIKVYYLNTGDTSADTYFEFKYGTNPTRLIQYNHNGKDNSKQFDLTSDSADKIFTYDNSGLLSTVSGFKGDVNNITYVANINRSGGDLKSFNYALYNEYYDCTTLQPYMQTKKVLGTFTVGTKNGFKTIHYVDTTAGSNYNGNRNCDYTVYFDATGRIQLKVLNGMMMRTDDICTTFKYYPLNDTVKQYFYDPATGALQKYVYKVYSGLSGTTPDELENEVYTTTYTNATQDNKKVSNFFKNYTWGKDLQHWFNYAYDDGRSVGGGTDYDFFQPEFDYLKFGICEKISVTMEDFIGHKSQFKNMADYTIKNVYDAKGNLFRCIPVGLSYSYWFEFVYK